MTSLDNGSVERLELVNFLLSDTCKDPLNIRMIKLNETLQKGITVTVQHGQRIRKLILSCVCKMVFAMRQPDMPIQHVVLCYTMLRTLLRVFAHVHRMFFDNWPELTTMIGSTMGKDTSDLTRVESVLFPLLVMFKGLEHFPAHRPEGKSRHMLMLAFNSTFISILSRLTDTPLKTAQEMNIVRCILRIFIAANNIEFLADYRCQSLLAPWLDCAIKIIANPPSIPIAVTFVQRTRPGARVFSRAIDLFSLVVSKRTIVPEKTDGKHYRALVAGVIAFMQKNSSNNAAQIALRSILHLLSRDNPEFRAELDPQVPLILTKCLYPLLKLNPRYDVLDDVCWNEYIFGREMGNLRPLVVSTITNFLGKMPTHIDPFIRFIVIEFTTSFARLSDDNSDQGAALTLDAALRAYASCYEFVRRGSVFKETLRRYFDDYFLPAFRDGGAFVQASIVRFCCICHDIFEKGELPVSFLSTLLFYTQDDRYLCESMKSGTVELIGQAIQYPSCRELIESSLESIMRLIFREKPYHSDQFRSVSATTLCAIAEIPSCASKLFSRMSSIEKELAIITDLLTDGNNDDPDLEVAGSAFVEGAVKIATAYLNYDHCTENPDYATKRDSFIEDLQKILKHIRLDESFEFHDSALELLDVLLQAEPEVSVTTMEIFGSYLTANEQIISKDDDNTEETVLDRWCFIDTDGHHQLVPKPTPAQPATE